MWCGRNDIVVVLRPDLFHSCHDGSTVIVERDERPLVNGHTLGERCCSQALYHIVVVCSCMAAMLTQILQSRRLGILGWPYSVEKP